MPLTCWISNSVRPINMGIKIGLVNNTFHDCDSSSVLIDACWDSPFSVLVLLPYFSSLSQSRACWASTSLFLLANQTGDSGRNVIVTNRSTIKEIWTIWYDSLCGIDLHDTNADVQANWVHSIMSPRIYEHRIPADIERDGNDPITPRILESVHSDTWKRTYA